MGFSLQHAFIVKAPADLVWAFLTDATRVASALPGAAITEKLADDAYNGTITVKVGPVSARYRGSVRFESLDAVGRTARIVGSGQDTSGRGGADLRMSSRLIERAPRETEVNLTSEINVTGILAQFGRGMIQDVSNQMVGRFTEAMRAQLEGPAAAPPAPATSAPAPSSAAAATGGSTRAGAPPAPSAPAAPPAPAPPIEVFSFGGSILGRALLRLLRRPGFWLFLLILVLIIWWLF
jgi:carbon monoxide dehydrogenase subunit G